MAVLSVANRRRVWRGLMRYWSANDMPDDASFLKEELFDAITDIDAFLDTNAGTINTTLPAPFRTTASTAQKAFLLAMVTLARHDPDTLRDILGETD